MNRLVFLLVFLCSTASAMAIGRVPRILTQEMLNVETEYIYVRADYTLAGATITIPQGKVLVFSGGSIDGGFLIGTETSIRMKQKRPAFGVDLVISGTWNVPEVHDGWFFFDDSEEFVSNQIIKNILAFSNDETPCHIFFEEKRTYFFELPFKERKVLGAMVSTKVVNGEMKRIYSDLYRDKFEFLRIFTIPSNTHLTVNNKLKMLPTSYGAYSIFWEYGKRNIIVDGTGMIAGDNDVHRYDLPVAGKTFYGEWGFIFRCFRCANFTFKDITLADAFGDCIIYSGSVNPEETEQRWSSGLFMENVKIIGARRNGLAVGARDVVIRNCYFENCGTDQVNGTKPRAAVDFEPDGLSTYEEIGNENVLMENCTFKGNYFDIASYNNNKARYGKIATTVRNCVFTSPVSLTESRWLRFENCYFPVLRNTNLSRHLEFVNCEFGELPEDTRKAPKHYYYTFTDCKFNSVVEKEAE